MPNLHIASDDDAVRDRVITQERISLLSRMSMHGHDVLTIVKVTPTSWVYSYIANGVEFRLTLDVRPERDPFSDD